MKTKEPYVPDLGLVYPDKPDGRMIKMKIVNDVKVDENYPFLDTSPYFKFRRAIVYLGIFTVQRLLAILRFDLRIRGRKNLRKNRKLLKNGAMSICNHVHRWDFPFSAMALRYRTMYFPVWKETLNSKDTNCIRWSGGIPVPDSVKLMKYFNEAFDVVIAKKKWIHAYPESSRFDYYQPIRPFKKGVFTIAHRYKLPVIPLAITYRKPYFPFTLLNFFRSLKGNIKLPLLTINVGPPVLIDNSLSRREGIQKLRKDCHEAMVRLAGIKNNPYPAEGD